jgi:ribosome-associated toxin RatA of RatAB toxin-antitoxin module
MAELEVKHAFNGDVNKVFRALGQFELYPEFIPGVTATKVLPPSAGSKAKCLVRTELNIVKTFYYTIEVFEDAPNRIWWNLIDSNLMKTNNGSWNLSTGATNETIAIYKLDVGFRGLVPSMITDKIAKANLPAMFDGFQKLINAAK